MFKYISKRLLRSILTLFIILTTVFLLVRLMPEDGYFGPRGDKLDAVQKEARLRELGLRDPLTVQLKNFYIKLLQGDLGRSTIYQQKKPVVEILAQKIPYSVCFGLAALALSLIIGIPMGIGMARSKSKLFDKIGTGYIVFINAVPAAVYYLFIQSYATGLLKIPMIFKPEDPRTWFLPCISMSLGGIASYAMWVRRYMVDELNKDYIKLALAKGVSRKDIMRKHVFRNAFVPMIQYLPDSILYTIAGSIYIESLYSIPGMGGLLVDVIRRQDNTLIQAVVFIFAAVGILSLLLGDILMAVLDPRIRLSKKEGAR